MKILMCGAGVIGSVYGARLARAGYAVSLLARGDRLREIDSKGVEIEDALTGETFVHPMPVVDRIDPSSDVELAIVAVRDSQVDALLPALSQLPTSARLLFMLNCPLRVGELLAAFGPDRAYFGFPGLGGVRTGGLIRYAIVRQQPTTFGPAARQQSDFPEDLTDLFKTAGFATAIVPDMEDWLKTHAFLITAISGALYRNGGKSASLAGDAAGLRLVADGLRESFSCLRSLGYRPSPARLRLAIDCVPARLVGWVLGRILSSEFATFAIDGHARSAPEDMRDLAEDCRTMMRQSGRTYPALSVLCDQVDRFAHGAARPGVTVPPAVRLEKARTG